MNSIYFGQIYRTSSGALIVYSQQVEHLLYDCGKLNNERGKLIASITKEDHWPVSKSVLVNKYLKEVINFSNSLDYEIM